MEATFRNAQPGDETAIHGLIVELAVYEREPNAVVNTAELIRIDLFEDKVCDAIVVEQDNKIIGFALYYTSYSTWKGRCLYLEDFYLQPAYRQFGYGQKLFDLVVHIAKERKVKRMDWQVLNWNEPAIKFYQKNKAILDGEWLNGRFYFE